MSAAGAPAPSRSDITRQLMDEGCSGSAGADARRAATARRPLCGVRAGRAASADHDLARRRSEEFEHGRLLAVDRLNKDPAPDQVLALALSLTLDLMRLQSGLSPDEITHQDLASELSALAATGSWLDLSQNLQRARGAVQRNVRLSSLLMGASR